MDVVSNQQPGQHRGIFDQPLFAPPPAEALLRQVLHHSAEGILCFDFQYRYTVWNSQMERISGLTAKEVLGRSAFEVFPFLCDINERRNFDAALNGETVECHERVFRSPATSRKGHFTTTYSPILNAEGEVTGGIGVIRDVTERCERQEAERRLEAEHAVAQVLSQVITIEEAAAGILEPLCKLVPAEMGVIWLLDKPAGYLFCGALFTVNSAKRYEKYIEVIRGDRFDRGEGLPGRVLALEQFVSVEDLETDRNFPRQTTALECGLHGAFAVPIASGSNFFGVLELLTAERFAADPHLEKMMSALGQDIAQFIRRRRAEAEVKRLNYALSRRVAELETLLQVMPVGVAIANDPRCEKLFGNAAFAEMLNLSTEDNASLSKLDVVNLPYKILREGKSVSASEMPMQVAAASGKRPAPLECEVSFADSSKKHFLITAAPLYNEDRRVRGAIGVYIDITRRKQVEAQLRDSEGRFRALFEQSPLAIQIFAADGSLRRVNEAEVKLWEPRNSAAGYNILQDEQFNTNEIKPLVQRAFAGERIAIVPFSYVHGAKQGGGRWLRAFFYPIVDDRGTVLEVVLMLEDVTTRIQAEEALREKEAQARALAAVVEFSDDAIISENLDGTITSWNYAAERMFGYTEKEMIGQHITRLLTREGVGEELDFLCRVRSGKGLVHLETLRLTKDGRQIDVSLTISPIKDARGEVVGASVIARNITEKKRAESALRQSESRFRQLAEAIPHIVWTAQADGTLEYCNDRWAEYTGEKAEGTRQNSWTRVVHPEFSAEVAERWNYALRKGELYELEYPLRGIDGNYRWHLDRSVPLKDGDGNVVKWFGTCTDIHEKKEAEEMVLKLNVELERRVHERTSALSEINEQMESFCYSVSHDLRAPVRAMRAFTQILMDDYKTALDAAAQDYLQRIGSAADRMDRLIQDLLQYSRIGRMAISLEPVGLDEAVKGVLTDLRFEIKQKQAKIEIVHALPVVSANPTLLDQVLLNLIGNALKFVPEGIAPHLKIWSEFRDNVARVCIRDNGIGIPAEYHKRIFEIFERLHGSELFPGTGIGLAIVQKSVSRMQGRLGVVSGVDEGSCFWFELPLAD